MESSILRTLEQLAAILLRAGLDAPLSEALLRRAFIFAANRSASVTERRVTQSQVASLAGVSRLEVRQAIGRKASTTSNGSRRSLSRLDQLVWGWKNDPKFSDKSGNAKPLSFRGIDSEFNKLVRLYGRDVTTTTLRVQLLRRGIAKERSDKLVLVRGQLSKTKSAAAEADLAFVAAQLSSIDFELGRRAYQTKRLSIPACDTRVVQALRRIASARLDTVLSSLNSLASGAKRTRTQKRASHRLLISATIAIESEGTK
jgi:hypothetical protein